MTFSHEGPLVVHEKYSMNSRFNEDLHMVNIDEPQSPARATQAESKPMSRIQSAEVHHKFGDRAREAEHSGTLQTIQTHMK